MSRIHQPIGGGRKKRAPNLFEEMVKAASEKELMKKQDEFQRFVASISCEFKFSEEIIVRPPAGEEFRMVQAKLRGSPSLVIAGGIGYEIFADVWTIAMPQKQSFDRFESKWTANAIAYDYYAADRVAFYQASFTPLDDTGTAVIFGGTVKIGRTAGIESPNDNAFLVDLNAMAGRLVKANKDEPGPGHLRFHCAGCIDGCLVVVGGVNAREELSNQIWKLKVSSRR